jgi:hypothetical protein
MNKFKHTNKCYKLFDYYQKNCKLDYVNKIWNIVVRSNNIDDIITAIYDVKNISSLWNMDSNSLTNLYNDINMDYIYNKRCIRQRIQFRDKCIYEEYRDKSHDFTIECHEKISLALDIILNNIRDILQQLNEKDIFTQSNNELEQQKIEQKLDEEENVDLNEFDINEFEPLTADEFDVNEDKLIIMDFIQQNTSINMYENDIKTYINYLLDNNVENDVYFIKDLKYLIDVYNVIIKQIYERNNEFIIKLMNTSLEEILIMLIPMTKSRLYTISELPIFFHYVEMVIQYPSDNIRESEQIYLNIFDIIFKSLNNIANVLHDNIRTCDEIEYNIIIVYETFDTILENCDYLANFILKNTIMYTQLIHFDYIIEEIKKYCTNDSIEKLYNKIISIRLKIDSKNTQNNIYKMQNIFKDNIRSKHSSIYFNKLNKLGKLKRSKYLDPPTKDEIQQFILDRKYHVNYNNIVQEDEKTTTSLKNTISDRNITQVSPQKHRSPQTNISSQKDVNIHIQKTNSKKKSKQHRSKKR